MSLVEIVYKNMSAGIAPNGQLVSIKKNGIEYMHGGGKPEELKDPEDKLGWPNSEITMFPVIGKPSKNRYVMQGNSYSMDQHGISRAIPFELKGTYFEIDGFDEINGAHNTAILTQTHNGRPIKNPKADTNPTSPKTLRWPAFTIRKQIRVLEDAVLVRLDVENGTIDPMNFCFGWHPAFRLQGAKETAIFSFGNYLPDTCNFEYIANCATSKTGACKLPGVSYVRYEDVSSKRGVIVASKNFPNTMLWTKDANSKMFCIEPVTHLPNKLGNLDGTNHETVLGYATRPYTVTIAPF